MSALEKNVLEELLTPEVRASEGGVEAPVPSVIVGTLIALADEGRTPLVIFRGQVGSAAVAARSVVPLHGGQIGRLAVLMFENGDARRPLIMGVIQQADPVTASMGTEQIEVDADGGRLLVTAKEQIVLRCGKASITLTRAGKVLIQGVYVSHRSTGVMRIKGGSVHLN
jgi:Domain of unknown function (DUF6484)